MNLEKLSRIDLNLLVCYKVLAEELSVTRAASRLCLSQSSVSKSLAKLRTQFDDPLFVRTSHGIAPTARTISIKPKLDNLIAQLIAISEPESFTPQTTQLCFNIALVESVYPLVLPHFLPAIFQQAPQLTISTHNWNKDTFKDIQNGQLDMGITGKDIEFQDALLTMLPPDDICEQEIYRDNQKCVVRKKHPCLNKPWNLEAYLKLRHLQVRCDGNDRWLLDYKLAEKGLDRDIAITVPDFNSAANLCSYTDFVFTAPSHFTNLMAEQYDLTVLPLPLEFPPMAYTLFWHKEREQDPALTWLRQIIKEKTHHLNS
ncbi:LysR family transcriptional regulator [Vibrio sp. HN007]|uniref:LysR family transcriptional regulator n=1 Tax=Vibrio iocasae TaxID=3098914 RepID=UPI0035D41DF6